MRGNTFLPTYLGFASLSSTRCRRTYVLLVLVLIGMWLCQAYREYGYIPPPVRNHRRHIPPTQKNRGCDASPPEMRGDKKLELPSRRGYFDVHRRRFLFALWSAPLGPPVVIVYRLADKGQMSFTLVLFFGPF